MLRDLVEISLCHVCTLVGLFISQWSTAWLQHKWTVLGRLTLTAALCGTQVEDVAFRLISLPTHASSKCFGHWPHFWVKNTVWPIHFRPNSDFLQWDREIYWHSHDIRWNKFYVYLFRFNNMVLVRGCIMYWLEKTTSNHPLWYKFFGSHP